MKLNTAIQPHVRKLLRRIAANSLASSVAYRMTRAGMMPRALWRRLPVTHEFSVSIGDGQTFQYSSDDGIGRTLLWKGMSQGGEFQELQLFAELAKRCRGFVDVGANTGLYSLIACTVNSSCRVAAFEPVPRILQLLKQNIAANNWNDRCVISNCAVSDYVGTADFHVPLCEVPTSASLHASGFRGYAGDHVQVPVTTLDVACQDFGPIDLMKIDVEGFEDGVLRGMTGILTRDRPTLVIECLPDGPYAQVNQILKPLGYRCYRVSGSSLVPLPEIIPDAREIERDFLCTVNPEINESFGP